MDGIEATKRFRESEERAVQNIRPEVVPAEVGKVITAESAEIVRFIRSRRRLPIIGMSANSDNDTKNIALKVGMDAFMAKPFSVTEFEEIVESLDLCCSSEEILMSLHSG